MSEQPTNWREMLDRMVEMGLGAALLTKEAAEKLVDDLVKRGSVTKEDGRRLFAEMVEKGRLQKERMDEVIAETVSQMLNKADLARRSQVEALEKRLAALEAEVRARLPEPPLPPSPV